MIPELSAKIDEVEDRLSAVEKDQAKRIVNVDAVSREVQDRHERAHNVIIHSLDEDRDLIWGR